MSNLDRFLQKDDSNTQGRYVYRFPNGAVVTVIPDPTRPLRWELLERGGGLDARLRVGLTSDEVEAVLTEIGSQSVDVQ